MDLKRRENNLSPAYLDQYEVQFYVEN